MQVQEMLRGAGPQLTAVGLRPPRSPSWLCHGRLWAGVEVSPSGVAGHLAHEVPGAWLSTEGQSLAAGVVQLWPASRPSRGAQKYPRSRIGGGGLADVGGQAEIYQP